MSGHTTYIPELSSFLLVAQSHHPCIFPLVRYFFLTYGQAKEGFVGPHPSFHTIMATYGTRFQSPPTRIRLIGGVQVPFAVLGQAGWSTARHGCNGPSRRLDSTTHGLSFLHYSSHALAARPAQLPEVACVSGMWLKSKQGIRTTAHRKTHHHESSTVSLFIANDCHPRSRIYRLSNFA
jgi:hypothetical protein